MSYYYYIKIPKWRAYLYDLIQRYQIYKRINLGLKVRGFKSVVGDFFIIKNCLIKFHKGGVLSKQKAFILHEFVKTVETQQARVSKKEFRLAFQLSNITKLRLENLMAELAELKKFAKEVGMSFAEIKGLDEEELVIEIIKHIDNDKSYSPEFAEWYEELPEELFEQEEEKPKAKDKAKGKKVVEEEEDTEEEFDVDEVTDIIENADDIKELYTVIDAFPDIFSSKLKKVKDMEELQEKLMEIIEEQEEEKPKKKSKKVEKEEKPKAKAKAKKKEDDTEEIVELINECEDVDDLKAIIKEYSDLFEDVNTRGRIKAETLKANMLKALGVESDDEEEEDEEEVEEKPKRGRGRPPKSDKVEKVSKKKVEVEEENEYEEMSLVELKKLAKERGIKVPFGTNKEKTIEMIMEAEEDTDEGEVEINPSTIKSMVKTKDLEGLQSAAEEMGITLKSLEKRSVKLIGEKLIEALEEKPKPKKTEKIVKKTKKSVFEVVKEMVAEGEKSLSIRKAIIPMLIEAGIDEDVAAKKAMVLIEVAQSEA